MIRFSWLEEKLIFCLKDRNKGIKQLPRSIRILLENLYENIADVIIPSHLQMDYSKIILLQFISLFFLDPNKIDKKNREITTWEEILFQEKDFLNFINSIIPKEVCFNLFDHYDYVDQVKLNKINWKNIAREFKENYVWINDHTKEYDQESNVIDFSIFDYVKFISRSYKTDIESFGQIYTPYWFALKLSEKMVNSWISRIHLEDSSDNRHIIKQISNLKILDPATGSSIFLIACGNIINEMLESFSTPTDEITIKKMIVENILFGIDIDTVAILISRLKLWLWSFDSSNSKETPFRCNIYKGNSLFGFQNNENQREENDNIECSRDDLFNKNLELKYPVYRITFNNVNNNEFDNENTISGLLEIFRKIPKFRYLIFEGDRIRWTSLKLKLDDISLTKIRFSNTFQTNTTLYAVFSSPMTRGEANELSILQPHLQPSTITNLFHWIDFKIGKNPKFDIILGNPPFIALTDLPLLLRKRLSFIYPEIYTGNNDISYFFLVRSIEALKPLRGLLGFILPKYLLHSVYAARTREFIQNSAQILEIHDFLNISLFNEVQISNIVLILKKKEMKTNSIAVFRYTPKNDLNYDSFLQVHQNSLKPQKWIFHNEMTLKILKKIREASNFTLNQFFDISKGVETGCDKVFTTNKPDYFSNEMGIKDSNLRTWIKGKDIKNYFVEYKKRKVIFAPFYKEKDILEDVKLMDYLRNNKELLFDRSRVQKYFLWRKGDERNTMDWERPKIVSPYKSKKNTFALDQLGSLSSKDVIWLIPKDEYRTEEDILYYLLSLLNSELLTFYALNSIKNLGNVYEFYPRQIEHFPIFLMKNSKNYSYLVNLVRKMFNNSNKFIGEFDKINKIIYELFKITELEIAYIKDFLSSQA
ncbi:MAG: hypothetical protein EAX86_02160 [Candidatus Heimdallarchaeota archaeon]|nr:hypothetical protein [Candidatus Heimdallarchaeota archaeon]